MYGLYFILLRQNIPFVTFVRCGLRVICRELSAVILKADWFVGLLGLVKMSMVNFLKTFGYIVRFCLFVKRYR